MFKIYGKSKFVAEQIVYLSNMLQSQLIKATIISGG